MILSVTLPLRLVNASNAREHHFTRARRVARERLVIQCALTQRIRSAGLIGAPCRVRITRLAPRKLDKHDNLCVSGKAIADEIARIVGVDDRDERWVFEYAQEKAKAFGVRIELEALVAKEQAS